MSILRSDSSLLRGRVSIPVLSAAIDHPTAFTLNYIPVQTVTHTNAPSSTLTPHFMHAKVGIA